MAAPKSSFRHKDTAGLVDSASHILHDGPINANYPTRSLQFLSTLRKPEPTSTPTAAAAPPTAAAENATATNGTTPAPVEPLNILIIGAGICGLSTAIALRLSSPSHSPHRITIIEQSPTLSEIGAGVQIPPNATRLLLRWGVGPHLKPHVVEPDGSVFRRWEDGAVIGRAKLMPEVGRWFSGDGGGRGGEGGQGGGEAPYWVVHRADYQRALFERAREVGVEVVFGRRVVRIDEGRGAVVWEGVGEDGGPDGREGEMLGDLVVAADGIHSEGRKAVLGDRDQPPVLTGLAAYRATIPAEKIKSDPDTAWMMDSYIQNGWFGPARHVVAYTIAGGDCINVVLIHPEPSDPSTWRQETALEDMKKQFVGWEPSVTKLVSLIDRTLKWPMIAGQALERWVSDSGKVVIVGDAAHAMLPFMSQGGAQAVEDGASLATLISSISSKSELPAALHVFEDLRIPRTAQVQQASFVNGRIFHFQDGPEQRARDEAMRDEAEGKHYIQSPNGLSDPTTQIWVYSYDAEEETRKAWEKEKRQDAKL